MDKWFANNVLATEMRKDPKTRKLKNYVIPGNWNEGSNDAAPVD